MKELWGIPIVESKEAGDSLYLLPTVRPVVYIPPQGFSDTEMLAAAQKAIVEAYTEAARRGEIWVIKNVK
jgi:hypothetical protein